MKANHIFTGYRSWTHADYGLNPEHPPLVKLLATVPLLWSQPKSPALEERFFKEDAFLRGKEFLYQNDADKILARTRTAAAILTLLTALVVFFGTREMFGTGAAFIALTLLTFDPNLLAHGALITTDVGLACFMFLSVYMFYRFVKSPSALRLIMAGAAVGLVLAVKHTGLLVLPILFLLALCEIVLSSSAESRKALPSLTQALRFVGAHRADRLGRPMVHLQISLRRTTKRSATESAAGRVCQRVGALRSVADFNSGSISHTS